MGNNSLAQKIDGLNLSCAFSKKDFEDNSIPLIKKQVAADWLSIVTFAVATQNEPDLIFDVDGQWWGERPDGINATIKEAREQGMKLMIKPQVWMNDGWVGDFDPKDEATWQAWQCNYQSWILQLGELAETASIELFCIGTEYKKAVQKRPEFWRNLIYELRQIYSGKITYASNWDHYRKVPFWDELDYAGVDSYFPLIKDRTPSVKKLVRAWQKGPVKELEQFHDSINKPILFTEYGYMALDSTGWEHWVNEKNHMRMDVNLQGQANALEAFYQALWEKEWVAGGFLWKWYCQKDAGGAGNKDYTPQNKPSAAVVRKWYLD